MHARSFRAKCFINFYSKRVSTIHWQRSSFSFLIVFFPICITCKTPESGSVQQVTRFIGRHCRITSHSIPALSRVCRHYHRVSRHNLARANVGAGFPHCPGVHGCIRPVTPSRPGLPHHISLNWEPSTLACRCCSTMTSHHGGNVWVLTRNCNTIIDIFWPSHILLEPTVPAFGPA